MEGELIAFVYHVQSNKVLSNAWSGVEGEAESRTKKQAYENHITKSYQADPLTPRRRSPLWRSTVRRARKQIPSRQTDSKMDAIDPSPLGDP